MDKALEFKDNEHSRPYYQTVRRCLTDGALNQFVEIDIEKDPRREIAELRELAEGLGETLGSELGSYYHQQAEELAEQHGIEPNPIIENSELEMSITKAFESLGFILSQRCTSFMNTKSFFEEMVQNARNTEVKLQLDMDKRKQKAPEEMRPAFDRVKQAYRAGLIVAINPDLVSYEDAMEMAAEQLKAKNQGPRL